MFDRVFAPALKNRYICDWNGFDANFARFVETTEQQLSLTGAEAVPAIKPFFALAFAISPELYRRISEAHAAEAARKAKLLMPPAFSLRRQPTSALAVGYLSSDLGDHPVGHQAWFHLHDRSRFHVKLFSLSAHDRSRWYSRLVSRFAEDFFDVSGVTGVAVARQINDAAVCVLVSLNGWTSGQRMDVLAMQAAPIQVAYIHTLFLATFRDMPTANAEG